jgi:2-keto-4-pentenoate hydratase/2-oxohepta-3-ene-1,7-dioic acid hydratase in catechol pathway
MRIASVQPDKLGVVRDDESIVLISDPLAQEGALPASASMIDLIGRFDAIRGAVDRAARTGTAVKLDPRQLRPPVPNPSKIWAAASNYRRGGSGIDSAAGRGTTTTASQAELLDQAFLKPPSAITGPEQPIVIPKNAETIFPELELCVVIGKESRDLPKERAMEAVFGYTVILDVTARSPEWNARGLVSTRCVRKGFDTFAPIGPWITTRDEIDDPQRLALRLWVNGQLRQSAVTDGMINGVIELVSGLSWVTTLYPGDLIATGNPDAPDFQEKLVPGDTLTAEIDGIGRMNLYVR